MSKFLDFPEKLFCKTTLSMAASDNVMEKKLAERKFAIFHIVFYTITFRQLHQNYLILAV